jgi:hypothetical protein
MAQKGAGGNPGAIPEKSRDAGAGGGSKTGGKSGGGRSGGSKSAGSGKR